MGFVVSGWSWFAVLSSRCWLATRARRSVSILAFGISAVGWVLLLIMSGPASASSVTPPVRHFAPRFKRFGIGSEVSVAGDYRLLTPINGSEPDGLRVVDVVTGRVEFINPPAGWGCTFAGLGPTTVVFGCQTGPGSTIIYHLGTGAMRAFSTFTASPYYSGIGTQWIAQGCATDPANEHTTISYRYANLFTGQVVADPRHIHGSTYADVDSPQLVQTACSPITVPGELDANVAEVPGDLEFFGRVGVRIYDVHDQSVIDVQHCGSTHREHFQTPGLVSNRQLLLWMFRDGRGLEGITEPQGRKFMISIPKLLSPYPIEGVELSNDTIYISNEDGEQVWAAPLPAALR